MATGLAAIIAAVLLANGAMGAGSPTSLHSISFSAASGTMSSGSYGVIADSGPSTFVFAEVGMLGWLARALTELR